MKLPLSLLSLASSLVAIVVAEPIPSAENAQILEREPLDIDVASPLDDIVDTLEKRDRGLSCKLVQVPGFSCGRHAQVETPSILETFAPVSATTCRNACMTRPDCVSYLFQEVQCVTYNKPLSKQGTVYLEESPALVYNRVCWKCSYSGT